MAIETLSPTQQQAPSPPSRPTRLAVPPALLIAVAAVVLVLLGIGTWIAYDRAQDAERRVAPAVEAGGVAVGGLTVTEAQAALEQHFAGLPDSQVIIRLDGRTWTFTARDLGISLDTAATAQAAKQAGRDV